MDDLLALELGVQGHRHLQSEPADPASPALPSPPAFPPSPPTTPPFPPFLPLTADGCSPALGTNPRVSALAVPSGALVAPRALAFNPIRQQELYVADSGRSAVTVLEVDGAAVLHGRVLKDRAHYHYMDHISSLAFDSIGQFATCQESLNTYEGQMLPNFFMGPTLYDTRVPLVNSKQQACGAGDTCFLIHTDMLHESPLCMGIVHDAAGAATLDGTTYHNVYWAFGGGHRQLVRYDFESDHGPGSMDHSKAQVRRYTGLELTRSPGVPSHMALDAASRELYISDSGANRVVQVNVDSGHYARDATVAAPGAPAYQIYSSPEASFNYTVWDGLVYSSFAHVPTPSGIALAPTYLYVGSFATGAVYAFDRGTAILTQVVYATPPGSLLGMALDPTGGGLYFIDRSTASVGRLVADQPCLDSTNGLMGTLASVAQCTDGVRNGEESGVDCGGRVCARCVVNAQCQTTTDCASSRCVGGVCLPSLPLIHSASFLQSYLSSDFYSNSFAHHMIHGDMGGASYLNPYPIMAAEFCDTVGRDNTTGALNCSRIDYDALLLGGCWCHECLPENPCANGGTCVNYQSQGYTCECPAGNAGDHCQHAPNTDSTINLLSSAFPFYALPPATSSRLSTEVTVALAVGWPVLLVVLFLSLWRCGRGDRSRCQPTHPREPSKAPSI